MATPKLSTISEDDLELSLLGITESKHEDLVDHRTRNGESPMERRSISTRSSMIRTLFSYPEKSNRPLRSTAWLDGLRGIAAAEVVLHHYHLHFLGLGWNFAYGSQPDSYQWWRLPFIRNYYHSAHAMVNVFFVISGFVLTQKSLSLIRSKQTDKLFPSLSSAVFRRFVRIFAPVVAVTFFGMILVRVGIKDSGVGFLPITYQASFFGQVADWYLATEQFCNPFHNFENQWDLIHTYEHVLWTLPIEYFGSLVCYITILGVARVTNTIKRSAIVCSIIYLTYRKANWWSLNFLTGVLLADFVLSQEKAEKGSMLHNKAPKYASINKTFWCIVFVWSFYISGLPDPMPGEYLLPGYEIYLQWGPSHFHHHEKGGRFWWMVAGTGLTFSISQLSSLRRICETRFCQYLGKISFMLYLIHTYMYALFGRYWETWLRSLVAQESYAEILKNGGVYTASYGGYLFVYIAFWVTMPPIVAIASGLVTRFVDEPSIKLAKRLEDFFTKDD